MMTHMNVMTHASDCVTTHVTDCNNTDVGDCLTTYKARHWHWPDGTAWFLKMSGQFGLIVFIFCLSIGPLVSIQYWHWPDGPAWFLKILG